MFRANRARGEGAPTARQESTATSTSLESLLALGLCAVVVLASMAFLRRSSDYSRVLVELQLDSLNATARRTRAPGFLVAPPRPELVILFALDSLRADHLDLYGYERETAPRLRRLGEEGIVFRTVCAQASQALTAHKSLLTGKYPTTLMFEETGADPHELARLPDPGAYLVNTFSRVEGRLAAAFREHGFRTGAFTDGAWTNRAAGFAHGFEQFDDSGGGLAAILPRALAWLGSEAADPTFLLVQAGDLACPYPARPAFARAFCIDHEGHAPLAERCNASAPLATADLVALRDHYDAALLDLDDRLDRFLGELRVRGLYERALIVVTAGHGESLGERGVVGHGGLFLEQLLVPLIVKCPQDWNLRPATITESAELVDLMPTLFALCGIPAAKDLDGRSLLPVLRGVRGRDHLVAQSAFAEGPGLRSSAIQRTLLRPGRWQVLQDGARSPALFFALDEDPQGLDGLPIAAEEVPELLDVLLGGRGEARVALRPPAPVRVGAELARALTQLGYGGVLLAGQGEASDLR